jgi:flagellar M-ring protein FliF
MFALWSRLDARRRAIAILATVAMFAAILGLSRIATTPGMALLYAGLDGTQAGEVITALDQEGVPYEVRGSSVFVDDGRRDELRMILAGQGLPANSGAGYELLDGLSGFGTTSQMFDAAYWRAKEGELARTVLAGPNIRSARVHIANPSPSPFQRDIAPSASVTVSTMGMPLSDQQANALRYLVASAVAGLDTAQVAIIDGGTGRLIGPDESAGGAALGDERAEQFKQRVERLLAARVGAGRAIVEVSVDTETDTESILERRIDPESRVAISSDSEETESSSQNAPGDSVTVASNLPSGDAGDGAGTSQSRNTLLRERINYDVSETTRQVDRAPGAVRRLTVAVLVDGLRDGAEWQPRSDAEMADLRELVASAVGFDEARGDVITLRSLQFEPPGELGTSASEGFLAGALLNPMRLIQLGVLALVALALGLFVVRPVLTSREPAALGPQDSLVLSGTGADPGDGAPRTLEPASDADEPRTEAPAIAALAGQTAPRQAPPAGRPRLDEDPVGHLKSLIEERQPDTIEILKTWLEDDKTRERA